jgi:ATP-dependent Clp protease ATP-binding subunit ClpA
MFERFTDRARRVIVVAQDEARNLGHGFIRPEHLALGLTVGEGVSARALMELGVTYDAVRTRVAAAVPIAEKLNGGERLPFSADAKKTLEHSLRQALALKHNYIGTEHILLGVLRVDDAMASLVFGVDTEQLRKLVVHYALGQSTAESPRSPALHAALGRAHGIAGNEAMTTGHVLTAIWGDPASHGARALILLGVTDEALADRLNEVHLEDTTDALPAPRSVEIRVGERTDAIEDAELAAALAALSPEQLQDVLRSGLAKRNGET